MTDCTATSQLLLEAERAYHQLMLGQSVKVFVDQNGERVEYTTANRDALLNYINALRSKITSGACSTPTQNRPLRFTF